MFQCKQICLCPRKTQSLRDIWVQKRTPWEFKIMFCCTSRKGTNLNLRSEFYWTLTTITKALLEIKFEFLFTLIGTKSWCPGGPKCVSVSTVATIPVPYYLKFTETVQNPAISVLVCYIDVPYHLTDINKLNYIIFALLISKQSYFSTFKNNMTALLVELMF